MRQSNGYIPATGCLVGGGRRSHGLISRTRLASFILARDKRTLQNNPAGSKPYESAESRRVSIPFEDRLEGGECYSTAF